jgi:hypothetical protein
MKGGYQYSAVSGRITEETLDAHHGFGVGIDRGDALKLAQLSAMNQLPLAVSSGSTDRPVRQWQSLIRHRHKLMNRQIAVKNLIRPVLLREAVA